MSKGQERSYSKNIFCCGVHVLSVVLKRFTFFIVGFVKTLRTCSLLCKYISLNKRVSARKREWKKTRMVYGFTVYFVFYAVWDFGSVSTEPFLYQLYQYFVRL